MWTEKEDDILDVLKGMVFIYGNQSRFKINYKVKNCRNIRLKNLVMKHSKLYLIISYN